MGSITPRLYRLPKIHKHDIPLRLILYMVNSAQHKLEKFLNFQLEPVLNHYSSYILKDLFFVDQTKDNESNNTFIPSFNLLKKLIYECPFRGGY